MGKAKDKERSKSCSSCEFFNENRNLRKHVKSLQREIRRLLGIVRALNKDGKDLKDLEDGAEEIIQGNGKEEVLDKCSGCGSTRIDVTEISFRGGKRMIKTCRECGKRKTEKV